MTQPAGAERRPDAVGQPGPSWHGDGALGGGRRAPGDSEAGSFAELGLAPAPIQFRALGFAVDQILFAVVFSVVFYPLLLSLGIVTAPADIEGLSGWAEIEALLASEGLVSSQVVITVVYRWVWNALGWSPGKRLVGLRLIDARGEPPGWARGLRRAGFALLSDLPLWLGYAAAMWDGEHRTWHDRVAGTWVVRTKTLDAAEQRERVAR
jgi:uncharacterized RDD family membrane protein YckC